MRQPIFIHSLNEKERKLIEAGLRSSDAFVMRRSQILLASARGERVPSIANALSCNEQTVRNAIHAFNQKGREALQAGSHRPRRIRTVLAQVDAETFKALLHRSPHDFGKPTGLWTLELVALVCVELGWTTTQVSAETIRQTLLRLGRYCQLAEKRKLWHTDGMKRYCQLSDMMSLFSSQSGEEILFFGQFCPVLY